MSVLFRYDGIDRTGDKATREAAFERFRNMLRDRMLSLSGELSDQDKAFGYLLKLEQSPALDNDKKHTRFVGPLAALEAEWNSRHALQILVGRIGASGSIFKVRTRFYFGDLHGHLPSRQLQLEFPISEDEFDTTADSHTLATLYAVAMDAKRRKSETSKIIKLMHLARQYGQGVPNNILGIPELKQAIERSLAELITEAKNAP